MYLQPLKQRVLLVRVAVLLELEPQVLQQAVPQQVVQQRVPGQLPVQRQPVLLLAG